jgi:hypothetical protein
MAIHSVLFSFLVTGLTWYDGTHSSRKNTKGYVVILL